MNMEYHGGVKNRGNRPPAELMAQWNRIIGLPEELGEDEGRRGLEKAQLPVGERQLTTRTAMQRYYTDQPEGDYYAHQAAAAHVGDVLGEVLAEEELREIEDQVVAVKRAAIQIKRDLNSMRGSERTKERELSRRLAEDFPDFDPEARERIIVQVLYGDLAQAA